MGIAATKLANDAPGALSHHNIEAFDTSLEVCGQPGTLALGRTPHLTENAIGVRPTAPTSTPVAFPSIFHAPHYVEVGAFALKGYLRGRRRA